MNWKRSVPLWAFLVGILATASVTAGLLLLPSLLIAKPDFTVSLDTPSMILIPTGNGNLTHIIVQPVRNFTGIVSLKAITSSPGITATFHNILTSEVQDIVLLGNAANVTLLVVATVPGNYTVNVIASSGNVYHNNLLHASVQNLTMTATPTYQNIARGSSNTTRIDLTSVNRLEGNLDLRPRVIINATGYSDPNSAIIFPHSVILPPGGTVTVVITIQVASAAQTGDRTVFLEVSKGGWIFLLTFSFNVV